MQLTQAFSALGDETRFAIVTTLLRDGPQPAGALNKVAQVSAPAISRHLKVLREAGIVRQQVRGQNRIYSVVPDTIRAINAWTMDHEAFWKASLTRLDAALKEIE
ncbi:HTH-type transcriptional regulator [Pseudoruegeria aquimaris]|uniref:HTH-type transcriptional regulator n=1 Tax=Pseudoruegeria aquimaris TaxID=393663 RepID=A0A1Y5RXQ5_9RHOB|nr:metalloregulator ArsR/SmtB family transcription factor [Pseudoruegeria aquimaris]SLN27953.1 HTH-type transcriptional regulator [Pseudoruegeria aquimaris]